MQRSTVVVIQYQGAEVGFGGIVVVSLRVTVEFRSFLCDVSKTEYLYI